MRKSALILASAVLAVLVASGVAWAATIDCRASADRCYGTNRSDTINGSGVRDIIVGNEEDAGTTLGDGVDLIYGNGGADRIYAADGADDVHGNDEKDTIDGNEGNDTLHGNEGDDVFFGGGWGRRRKGRPRCRPGGHNPTDPGR